MLNAEWEFMYILYRCCCCGGVVGSSYHREDASTKTHDYTSKQHTKSNIHDHTYARMIYIFHKVFPFLGINFYFEFDIVITVVAATIVVVIVVDVVGSICSEFYSIHIMNFIIMIVRLVCAFVHIWFLVNKKNIIQFQDKFSGWNWYSRETRDSATNQCTTNRFIRPRNECFPSVSFSVRLCVVEFVITCFIVHSCGITCSCRWYPFAMPARTYTKGIKKAQPFKWKT